MICGAGEQSFKDEQACRIGDDDLADEQHKHHEDGEEEGSGREAEPPGGDGQAAQGEDGQSNADHQYENNEHNTDTAAE